MRSGKGWAVNGIYIAKPCILPECDEVCGRCLSPHLPGPFCSKFSTSLFAGNEVILLLQGPFPSRHTSHMNCMMLPNSQDLFDLELHIYMYLHHMLTFHPHTGLLTAVRMYLVGSSNITLRLLESAVKLGRIF